MKIEDMAVEDLMNDIERYDNVEIRKLRDRFIRIYQKHFENNSAPLAILKNGLTESTIMRSEFMTKYEIVFRDIKRRKLKIETRNIDHEILKRSVFLDVSGMGDFVAVENYISIGGSFVKTPKDAEDVDIIVRDSDSNRDESLELKLRRIIEKKTGKDAHFVYAPKGPHSDYIPVFDLVLRSRGETKKVSVKETVLKGDEEYYAGLDKWDDDYRKDNEEVKKNLAEGSVLDLGCGTGRLLKILKDEGRDVVGVDNNDTALEYCRKRGIETRKLDLEKDKAPFNDGAFDNVIMVHALEHLEEPDAAILEACRLAKKRVVILSPLGKRFDPTHKQEFKTFNDFAINFGRQWKTEELDTNSAIAVRNYERVWKARLSPFGRFTPPKPTMAGLTEAFSVDEIWDWAQDRLPLDVEEKLNGFRFVIEKAGSKLRLKTEGNKDQTNQLPMLAEVLKRIPDDFIADCSMGIEHEGKALPRIKIMTLMADKPEIGEGDVVKATLFDLPYWKEDLHEKPLSERRKSLESFFSKYLKASAHFGITSFNVVKDKAGLESQFKKLSKLPQSEGMMLKSLESKWDTDGSASEWVKLKHEAEIKVVVLERHSVSGGNYNYTCGLLPGDSPFENLKKLGEKKYVNLGKCFNTKLKAEPGDILTMGVEEIIPKEKKLDWLGARVVDIDKDRSEPYSAQQAMDIAERANVLQKTEGNVDYSVGDTGHGVLQLHIMGVDEEDVIALRKVSKEAVGARSNPTKLKMLIKGAIGEQGCHIDVRLVKKGDDFFEGGEIMVGNLTGLDKVKKLDKGGKLRFGWKVPHAEEPSTETIRGPVEWMDAGKGRIEIFPPGNPGATANQYGAMLLLDSFNWEAIEPQDRHAKKFNFKGTKFIPEGTYLTAYIPVAEGRVWMISKLKETEETEVEKEAIFKIVKIDKKQQIVGGIVYEPDVVDSQGDTASVEEIQKAMYSFMERYADDTNRIKVMHKGKPHRFPVIECFQPEHDMMKGGRTVKAGSWWMMLKVPVKEIWNQVESGKLTAFSMGGRAKEKK